MNHGGFEHNYKRLAMAKLVLTICGAIALLIPIIAYVLISAPTDTNAKYPPDYFRTLYIQLDALFAVMAVKFAGVIFVINWLVKAIRNAKALNHLSELSSISAKLSWFTPIWNLFGPYLLVRRLANTTPIEDRKKLDRHFWFWSILSVIQTQPLDLMLLYRTPWVVAPVIEFLLYPVACFHLVKIMSIITVSQEMQLANQQSQEVSIPARETETDTDEDVVINLKQDESIPESG